MNCWSRKIAAALSLVVASVGVCEEILPEKNAELLIWTDTPTLEYMKYAAGKFNETFGYNVSFNYRALAPMNIAGRMIQDGGTARVADVGEIEHDMLGKLVVGGAVMENLVSADRIDNNFIGAAVTASKAEGLSYGFPVSYATTALFYNKDILTKAPETFEELIQFSGGFNNLQENKYTLLWDVQNYYESRMFLALHGGYEFGNKGMDAKDIGVNSPEAINGLTAMNKLKAANNSNPVDMRNPQVRRGLFNEGKVAAIVDGPWATEGYLKSGVNVGVIPMPTLEGKHPRTFTTVRLAVVSTYSEYPRAAQLFADFLATEDMLKKRFEMTRLIPPMENIMSELAEEADEASRAFISQGYYADAMPSIPEMGYVWSPMANAITASWVNGQEPKKALDNALKVIKEQISFQQ
ncbi:sugar ABC transporter substrate-binding protein [Endozoicomonas euniceicola]|uniref:Maltose ABC transporter substrate-binding protein n=1 Tax=Endozoicomonas euniceicola TaxID=1234143 RepID=A0ABY6GYS9_9GAMM|nr:maltose ABC transporter substrate-binding protein [Endozoicomonas euniceicola]UYM17958.1 maltose ABC transporter substrate-binding protein [Endozoicomonas euniceicola]